MAFYYVDSSVLVRRHTPEIGSAWVESLTDPAAGNTIIISRISTVEVLSAFQRKRREGGLTDIQAAQLTDDFLAICTSQYTLLDVTEAVLHLARQLVQRHPLKAYDAVQLASALLTNAALEAAEIDQLILLAGDRQLLKAAMAENIAVDDPQAHG